jgi:hypothetical protein
MDIHSGIDDTIYAYQLCHNFSVQKDLQEQQRLDQLIVLYFEGHNTIPLPRNIFLKLAKEK